MDWPHPPTPTSVWRVFTEKRKEGPSVVVMWQESLMGGRSILNSRMGEWLLELSKIERQGT
jgi:hypothetical protein